MVEGVRRGTEVPTCPVLRLIQLLGPRVDYPTSDEVIEYPNTQRVFVQPRPLAFRPIHQARVDRGSQPWVREPGTRRQFDEGPQQPISMLERAGTSRDGIPRLFIARSSEEIRIQTQYWDSMSARQRQRWNSRVRSQFPGTASTPTEALNHHHNFLQSREQFCRQQATRMSQRGGARGGRGGRGGHGGRSGPDRRQAIPDQAPVADPAPVVEDPAPVTDPAPVPNPVADPVADPAAVPNPANALQWIAEFTNDANNRSIFASGRLPPIADESSSTEQPSGPVSDQPPIVDESLAANQPPVSEQPPIADESSSTEQPSGPVSINPVVDNFLLGSFDTQRMMRQRLGTETPEPQILDLRIPYNREHSDRINQLQVEWFRSMPNLGSRCFDIRDNRLPSIQIYGRWDLVTRALMDIEPIICRDSHGDH